MVFIGATGFEFDNMFSYGSTLSKTTTEITLSSKRFTLDIDYNLNGLSQNELHKIKIINNKINVNDTIVINVCTNMDKLITYPVNIIEGECYVCLMNMGSTITDTITVSILILT